MYKDKKVTTVDNIKFLGLTLDNSLTWENILKLLYPNRRRHFCYESIKTHFVFRCVEINILLILPFNSIVWNNILGLYPSQQYDF